MQAACHISDNYPPRDMHEDYSALEERSQKHLYCNWATSWEKLFLPYANKKGADQPAHPRSLISAFVVRPLDSGIPLLAISKTSRPWLVSVAEQAGLSFTWSQIPKTGFLVTRLNYKTLTENLPDLIYSSHFALTGFFAGRICPVWSEPSLSTGRHIWSLAIHWAHSEDSDQTGPMPRLIWVYAGRTGHFVGFVMRRLFYSLHFALTGFFGRWAQMSFRRLCCASAQGHWVESVCTLPICRNFGSLATQRAPSEDHGRISVFAGRKSLRVFLLCHGSVPILYYNNVEGASNVKCGASSEFVSSSIP